MADSNFSYWHSATFNNDGTKILFSDEWGGGGQPKCRAGDPLEWGADAIFTIEDGKLVFQSYYKMPAPQSSFENCVAHNGSMIPIPGRDVMVQAWYQGGISVFDFTDPKNPIEIAFHDRGPIDPNQMVMGGSWSVYWYNGLLVSSEIARGLDIFELVPSEYLTQNEIDAANTVRLEYLNAQGQPQYVWPASFALARAYVDQLERSKGLSADRIASVRQSLAGAERASGAARRTPEPPRSSRAAASTDAKKVDADAIGICGGREATTPARTDLIEPGSAARAGLAWFWAQVSRLRSSGRQANRWHRTPRTQDQTQDLRPKPQPQPRRRARPMPYVVRRCVRAHRRRTQ